MFTFPTRKLVRLGCGFGPFLSSNLVATCPVVGAREKSDVWRSTHEQSNNNCNIYKRSVIVAECIYASVLRSIAVHATLHTRFRVWRNPLQHGEISWPCNVYVLKLVSHCDRHARFMALPTERVARSPVGTANRRPATAWPSMNDDDRRKPVRPATTVVVISRLPRCRHADIDCRLLFIGIPALGWHALTLVALKFQCLSVTVPKSLRGWRAVRLCRPLLLRAVFRWTERVRVAASMHRRSSAAGHRSVRDGFHL